MPSLKKHWHAAADIMIAIAVLMLQTSSLAAGDEEVVSKYDTGDVYFMIGEQPAWLGNRIRYTVFEPTIVEGRIISMTGEIILLFQLGEQAPGQYTLPWHTTPEGLAMAGMYTLELYFGDEYAVKSVIAVMPATQRSI